MSFNNQLDSDNQPTQNDPFDQNRGARNFTVGNSDGEILLETDIEMDRMTTPPIAGNRVIIPIASNYEPQGTAVPRQLNPLPNNPISTVSLESQTTPTRIVPDVNIYQQKKTVAQGMMDIALMSANANQLRLLLATSIDDPYKVVSLVLIVTSIFLQIAVGMGLIWNCKYDVKKEAEICEADKINNYTVMGIFILTAINLFIASFTVVKEVKCPA